MTFEHSPKKAAAWMSGWLTAMVVMAIAGREATKSLHVFQIMEMRSLLGLVLLYPLVRAQGGFAAMRTGRAGMHVARNGFHYAAQFAWFLALTMIPIAQVVAIVLGLIGVTAIVRPQAGHLEPGQLVALGAAVGFAISVIMVKSLTKTESAVAIIFWMLIVQSAIGAVPALLVWRDPALAVLPWILVISVCGTYSHYCMTRALQHAEATTIVPMDFLRVPLSALAAWLVYAEAVDVWTVLGAALILGGNALNLRRPAPPAPKAAAAPRP